MTASPQPTLLPCPCCGYATLYELSMNDICTICRWEDDGYDNRLAQNYSPPNRLNLNLARFNFIQHGIAKRSRSDLRDKQEPRENFKRVRFFEISEDGYDIIERSPAEPQKIIYQGIIPFASYDDFDESALKKTEIATTSPKLKWSLKK